MWICIVATAVARRQLRRAKLLKIREGQGDPISSPALVAKLMAKESKRDRETFWVLHLNVRNQLVEKELVAIGTLNNTVIHPREVFKKAILNSAATIITVHNHPSGDASPSKDDREVWAKLREAGKIIGIPVVDDLIVTPGGAFYSEKGEGGHENEDSV